MQCNTIMQHHNKSNLHSHFFFQECITLQPDSSLHPPPPCPINSNNSLPSRQVAAPPPTSSASPRCAHPLAATRHALDPAPHPALSTMAALTGGAGSRGGCTLQGWAPPGCRQAPPSTARCPCRQAQGAWQVGVTPLAVLPADTHPRTW